MGAGRFAAKLRGAAAQLPFRRGERLVYDADRLGAVPAVSRAEPVKLATQRELVGSHPERQQHLDGQLRVVLAGPVAVTDAGTVEGTVLVFFVETSGSHGRYGPPVSDTPPPRAPAARGAAG